MARFAYDLVDIPSLNGVALYVHIDHALFHQLERVARRIKGYDRHAVWIKEGKWMLKVFLVEDESIVREGLKNNFPWQEYGYQFMGEASDGEMALPMIRKAQPNVLITDIKMTSMSG